MIFHISTACSGTECASCSVDDVCATCNSGFYIDPSDAGNCIGKKYILILKVRSLLLSEKIVKVFLRIFFINGQIAI